jgi:F-type H+-transporting ATPase subunit delta
MSELATLARPYAAAVFKRAKQTGDTAAWSDNLAFLAAVMADTSMTTAIANPKIGKKTLEELVFDVCKGHLNQEGSNFVRLLLQNNRMPLLPSIAKLFEEMRAESEGYIEVEVLTAFPLSKESEQKMSAKLQESLNKKVYMKVTVDKSLIGGVLVRAGDRVIDGSVKGQLQTLRKALL